MLRWASKHTGKASDEAGSRVVVDHPAVLTRGPCGVAQVLFIAGGITVGSKVRGLVKDAQRQQRQLCAELSQGRPANFRKQTKIAVDKKFLRRLLLILSMWVVRGDLAMPCAMPPVPSASPYLAHAPRLAMPGPFVP